MKKNLGVVQAVYPMPVLMVAAYDENGTVHLIDEDGQPLVFEKKDIALVHVIDEPYDEDDN